MHNRVREAQELVVQLLGGCLVNRDILVGDGLEWTRRVRKGIFKSCDEILEFIRGRKGKRCQRASTTVCVAEESVASFLKGRRRRGGSWEMKRPRLRPKQVNEDRRKKKKKTYSRDS
jgi:hypothetical protein